MLPDACFARSADFARLRIGVLVLATGLNNIDALLGRDTSGNLPAPRLTTRDEREGSGDGIKFASIASEAVVPVELVFFKRLKQGCLMLVA